MQTVLEGVGKKSRTQYLQHSMDTAPSEQEQPSAKEHDTRQLRCRSGEEMAFLIY